ncbi:MAG: DUF362 domain-containing protein [candidate division KSB1 bacterium]|nr:DUF362 domain-containing protein [candidate division KSB1 bacterium]
MQRSEWSRRVFLRRTAMASFAPSLLSRLPLRSTLTRPEERRTAKVVWVQHKGVMDEKGNVNRDILGAMLDRAICELAGEKDPAAALAKYIHPEDVVGLKVNTLGLRQVAGTPYVSHFMAVAEVLTGRLARIIGKPERVVVWDRNNGDLQSAGYRINVEGEGMRCYGTQDTVGYDDQDYAAGERRTRFSRILTQHTTALINVPVVKTHPWSGVTGALKNHYGSIANPNDFHNNNCTQPGIPEINALPPVREKTRLIVVDALWVVFEHGPRWGLDFMQPLKAIWASTDPVAVDRVILDTIDRIRAAQKLPSVAEAALHIELAGKMGLGEWRLEKIDLNRVVLG